MEIKLTYADLMIMLNKAAQEGIRIGEAGTKGEHTDAGISAWVVHEYLDHRLNTSASVKRGDAF